MAEVGLPPERRIAIHRHHPTVPRTMVLRLQARPNIRHRKPILPGLHRRHCMQTLEKQKPCPWRTAIPETRNTLALALARHAIVTRPLHAHHVSNLVSLHLQALPGHHPGAGGGPLLRALPHTPGVPLPHEFRCKTRTGTLPILQQLTEEPGLDLFEGRTWLACITTR